MPPTPPPSFHWVATTEGSQSSGVSFEDSSKSYDDSGQTLVSARDPSSEKVVHQVFSSASSVNFLEVMSQSSRPEEDEAGMNTQADLTLHALGHCRPCHYMGRSHGCLAGADCKFCHEQHDSVKRPRPSKTKRQQVKRILDRIEGLRAAQPDCFAHVGKLLSEQNGYLQSVLRGREAAKKKEARQGSTEGDGESVEPDAVDRIVAALNDPAALAELKTSKRKIGILEQIVVNAIERDAEDSIERDAVDTKLSL